MPIFLIFVLPALGLAFNGIRKGIDLVRLVERSAMTAATLTQLRGLVCSTSMNYDTVANAALRAASIISDELSEWRFVLESRRARTQRSHILGRARHRLTFRYRVNSKG